MIHYAILNNMEQISYKKYSIATFFGLASIVVGLWVWPNVLIGALGTLVLIVTASLVFSNLWTSNLVGTRLGLGLLVSICFMMLFGSAVYYLGTVTTLSMSWIPIALPFVAFAITRKVHIKSQVDEPKSRSRFSHGIYAALFAIAIAAFFVWLNTYSTLEPSRSPWLIVSPLILLCTFVASGITFRLAQHGRLRLVIAGSTVTLGSILSVALFVFTLGYGFDPFLHQATIDHIFLHGTITPKPFYYIGQYSLELIAMFTAGLDAHTIDIYLLPILTAILLPITAMASVWQITRRAVPTGLAALGALLIPLGSFINTTPQGLAYLLTLTVLLLALPELVTRRVWTRAWVLILVSVAAISVHPLAGLPALLFVLLVILSRPPKDHPHILALKRVAFWALSIAGAVMLPAAFLLGGTASLNIDFSKLGSLLPDTFFSTRFDVLGDLFALITINGWIWLTLLSIVAVVILWSMESRRFLIYPLMGLILIINASVLVSVGDFSFLIDYEQTNYTGRVMYMALLFILPLAIVGFALGTERILVMKKTTITVALILIFSVAVIANMYASYPRHGAYAISRGFTVGISDHNTVSSIASHAGETPYIALANQAVSAAAIQDNGFLHYYGDQGDVFYYPVPTGGPMYQVFLEMIEKNPTHDLALKAMDLSGVDLAYFVVNDYWWSADVAIERARATADDYFIVDDGAVWVFVYERLTADSLSQ